VGQTVIVLDDLYQSGATINEMGRTVRARGAKLVLGLAVTKTQKDV
jgi:predicted amidophosphoribosyltransferase